LTENVFDQKTETTPQVAPIPNADPLADKLKALVNKEGKPKYDNAEKAIDALIHSQAHIERLEQEAAERNRETEELRIKAAQAEALEAVIERLKPNSQAPEQKQTPSSNGLSEEATIAELEKIIEKREATKIAQANFNAVNTQLLDKFKSPEAAKAAVAAKAAELGMTTADLAALSMKSPKAVLSYFGEAPRTVQPTTPSSSTPLSPPNTDEPVKRPEKSVLMGATSKEQKAHLLAHKEAVYKRHGIES
jgi:hypothetical protein